MRRLLVLIALLAVMLGLKLLQAESSEQQNALVLAAIGFVLLASFTVAEMGSSVTLPRVTGYILTGALLASFGILSPPVVLEMKMFNTLALGLIAISAGLELSLSQLKKVIRTLSATIVAKLLIAAPLVGAAFFLIERYWAPLALESTNQIIAGALVIGALSLGTSPAIALAIISETKSRGRLSDIVLGASVLKDLVVVVALAIAVAIARGMISNGEGGAGGLGHVFVEIGYSILAGGLLGLLLILYIRYVKAEMLLFVAAIILVVAELASLLHLELLLVFIAGGFVVRNFSDYEHELLHPVQLVSLPVFVVFFTIAGASIDLVATWRILPLALALCAVRAFGFYFSARVGNAIGGEADAVKENAWLGYLPQAGVTLGLVGLASTQLPSMSEPLLAMGMAVVAVNLLLGPIALRAALKRAGEVPGAAEAQADVEAEDVQEEGAPSVLSRLPSAIQSPFERVEKQLEHQWKSLFRGEWSRWSNSLSTDFRSLGASVVEREKEAPDLWEKLRLSDGSQKELIGEHREIFLNARKAVRTLPEIIEVELEEGNRRVQQGDAFGIVLRKRWGAIKRGITFVRHPTRRVPVRELGRLHFEPRLAELTARIWASRMRLVAGALEEIAEAARGTIERDELEVRLTRRFDQWEGFVRQESRSLFHRALSSLLPQALVVDSAYLSSSRIRASSADRSVRVALHRLEDGSEWIRAFDSVWAGISMFQKVRRQRVELERALCQGVVLPSQETLGELGAIFEGWQNQIESLVALVDEADSENYESQVTETRLAFEAVDAKIHGEGAAEFELAMAVFRSSLDLRVFSHTLESSVASLPEVVVLPLPETPPSSADSATEIDYRRLEPRKIAERIIVRDAGLGVERAGERAEEAPRKTARAIFAVLDSTRLEVRSLANEPDAVVARTRLKGVLGSTTDEISRLVGALRETEREELAAPTGALCRQLDDFEQQLELEGRSIGELVRGRRFAQVVESLRQQLHELKESVLRSLRKAQGIVREAVHSEFTLEVQAKFRAGDLDAGSVRDFLARHEPEAGLKDYTPFFNSGPLREASNFVAHRGLLRQLLDAERAWIDGGPSSVLIVGSAGSGRTSLLNLLQHGSFAKSLIRPSPVEWRRKVGLLQSLGYELGCRPRPLAIEKALSARRALIIVDDLEQWLQPGLAGVEALETFLDLVARTRKTAFWVVSTTTPWFELANRFTDLAGSFWQVARLGPVSSSDLREAIERRHQSTGRDLHFPSNWLGKLLSRGRPDRDRDLFFRLLARASGGNLTRALGLWLHMANVDTQGAIRLRLSRALVVGLPFVRSFSAEQVALLVLLCRHGPLVDREIAEELCCSRATVRRQLTLLLGAGLLQTGEQGRSLIHVKSAWAPILEEALLEVRAL